MGTSKKASGTMHVCTCLPLCELDVVEIDAHILMRLCYRLNRRLCTKGMHTRMGLMHAGASFVTVPSGAHAALLVVVDASRGVVLPPAPNARGHELCCTVDISRLQQLRASCSGA